MEPETALLRSAVLHREQHRTGPLAAQGEALHDAQQQQQDRGDDADLCGGRQQTHQGGGPAHQEHRQRQGALAADAVTDVAEDESADRAHQEADGEGGEGQHGAHEGALIGEERGVEDQTGRGGVEEEVVPLDGGAHQAGPQCRAHLRAGFVGLFSGLGIDNGHWPKDGG
jgi:hypothetical protein